MFWRPGCVFCAGLIRGLERAGLSAEYRDIWQDEDAAAFVRSVTGGDETVPTVRVGPLAMVNPSRAAVLDAVAEHAPNLLPAGTGPRRPGLVTRLTRAVRGT